MSSEIAKEIVQKIADGKMDAARESINSGFTRSASDAVDMKRIEMSLDWTNNKK